MSASSDTPDMQDLYLEMKEALRYFGLSFHDMAEVQVSLNPDTRELVFTHGARRVALKLK